MESDEGSAPKRARQGNTGSGPGAPGTGGHGARWHGVSLRGAPGMYLLTLVIGLSAGFAAFVYFWMTEAAVRALVHLYQDAPTLLARGLLVLAPALGGLLTGAMFHWFAPDAKGGGVPEVIDALLHRDGMIRLRVGFWKALASVVCIGSGGSTGREGPVVQIGASVGSALAQTFHVTRHRAQLLVACGAAAGIAAVFNAPIAGAFFAAEVIIGSFEMRDLTLLFTAAASSMVVARTLLWNHAAFPIPQFHFHIGIGLVLHLLLGIIAALAGHLFVITLHRIEHRFRHSPIPEMWRPALGGLLLGILAIGLGLPQVLGTGAPYMETLFTGHLFATGVTVPYMPGGGLTHLIAMLALLALAKVLATSLTLGSGGAGGDLMPAMFIGGSLGGAYGLAIQHFLPGATLPPGVFALVGAMGTIAGIAHAPVTAIVLGIEATYNYGLVLPLMLCCSASALMSSWLRTSSVYVLKLEERGVDVKEIRRRQAFPVDPLDRVQVEDIMTRDFASVPPDLSVSALLEEFARTSHHGFVVVDDIDRLLGVVTLSDAPTAPEATGDDAAVADIMTPAEEVVTCFPGQTLREVLLALGAREVGRIPVMDPLNTSQVIGVLRRGDILRGSRQAAKIGTSGARARHGRFIGIPVTEEDPWPPCRVRDLDLPEGVLLVSLRRGNQVLIPRGDTMIEVGDYVTALVEPEAEAAFRKWRAREPA